MTKDKDKLKKLVGLVAEAWTADGKIPEQMQMENKVKRKPGRPAIVGLTPAQTRTLEAIARLGMNAGYPPTFREVASEVGTQHSAVYVHAKNLREQGFVLFGEHELRTLRITEKGRAAMR